MRRLLGLVMAGLLVLGAAPATLAAKPVVVDPATLTPPLGSVFDGNCLRLGQSIECVGKIETSGVDFNPDPSFSCAGNPILVTFRQVTLMHRSNDAAGRATRIRGVTGFDEVWRLAGSSRKLASHGRYATSVDFAVPGDFTSRTVTYTGNLLRVSAPGDGVLIRNDGRLVLNWDESEVLAKSGHHDMVDDPDGAIARVCAAFAR